MRIGSVTGVLGQSDEVLYAAADVPDLVVKDSLKNGCAPGVAQLPHPLLHGGRDIQPARFQDHRDHGEAGGDIVTRLLRCIP